VRNPAPERRTMPISDEEGQALIQEEQEYRAMEYRYNLEEANLEEGLWQAITNLELEVKALRKQIRLLEIEVRGWKY
tara:strand:- start:2426 stop:2656 length:231 start_codon:yes stop_codon:yes gene_type:complete